VRDADGTVLCTAGNVTFYVQRPSLDSPQSPLKPSSPPPPPPPPVH